MKKKQKAPKPQIASKRTQSSKVSISSTANRSKWIRIDRPFSLPEYVKSAIQRLDDAGHIAYVVGGSVRDFLLGRESKDLDIATSANPDEICKIFPDAITVGKAFGVLKIPVQSLVNKSSRTVQLELLKPGSVLEIATFREDLEYRDYRHPSRVRFAGPAEDASRRDFTINALFYDPKTARILDTVDGMGDLKAETVRAIGNPEERFKEDALRLLRAVRFTAALGFSLDAKTAEACQLRAKLITNVSAERIRDELNLMLTGSDPSGALVLLSKLSLLKHVLPELEAMKGVEQIPRYHPEGDVWSHTIKMMACLNKQVPSRSIALSWGALLHDIGKPIVAVRSGGKNFNGHEIEGAKIATSIGSRFKLSRTDIDRISALVADHLKFKDVFKMRESTLQRFLLEPHFEELLALHKADSIASDGNLAYYEFCYSRFKAAKEASLLPSVPLIDGDDLIQLGFSPGPRFTEILRTVEDLAIEKKIRTKEEALEYVLQHFVR